MSDQIHHWESKGDGQKLHTTSSKEGYETAKQMMHKLYGDPHRVIAAYRKEIKQWPQIKPGDAEAYRKFHNFLP